MRSLPLLAAGAVLYSASFGLSQTTQPAAPSTRPAAIMIPQTQPASAATTQPAATRPSADSFLPGLGSDSWQTRLHTADQIVRMGEDGRPIIKELLARPIADVEVRARLEAALSQIEENRAIGTSFITMHLQDATPRQIFDELSRQCYAKLKPFPDNLLSQPDLTKVSIDLDRVPFWTAMNKIAEKTGIDLQQYNEGVRLMRGGFHQTSPWSVVKGPFLVMGLCINRTQTEQLANGGGSSSDFSMQMMAYSEPKIHVLNSSAGVKIYEAVDDAGNSLMPTGPSNRGYYGGSGGCWNLYAQLKYPDHPGKKIALFKGSATFLIQTRSEKIEIPNLRTVKDFSRMVGDMPVVFHELKKNGNMWEFRLSTPMVGNRWQQLSQSVQSELKLLDASGQPLNHNGMRSSAGPGGFECTIMFSNSFKPDGTTSTDPVKLFWEVPTGSKEISIDFEFKNLPMPK